MVENVYCSNLECTNVVCDKNLKILAPIVTGNEIIIKHFGKTCLENLHKRLLRQLSTDQDYKNEVN